MPENDPWDEEAAHFKQSGASTATAEPAHNEDDYSIWNQTKQGATGSQPRSSFRGRIESAINDPSNVPDTGWRGEIEKFGQGAAQGLTQPFLHPLKTLGSMAEATPAGAVFDLATGRKNASQQQAEDLVHGLMDNPSQTAGQLAGGFAGAHVLPAAAETAGRAVSRFQNFRPKPSPNIVSPAETAARNLTNAVNPEPARAPSYIKAAQAEVPNVLDYARRTNNPLRTQAEFAKAAEGNAQEAANHYNNNVLGPHEDLHVPVPKNYGGTSYTPGGENPQTTASLGDINKRVVQINKELSKPKLNVSDQRTALAQEADLQAEHAALTDLLHRSLSNLTGIPPEEIANLRQRVGRSYELANDTNAAVTKRGLKEGQPVESIHGLGVGNLVMKGADLLRGGPTAITDRAFQSAIKNFPGQAQPLPRVTGPVPKAPAASPPRPNMPRVPATEIPIVNTGDVVAQAETRNQNLSRFNRVRAANAQAAEQAAADEAARRATAGKRLQILAQQKGLVPPDEPLHEDHTIDTETAAGAQIPIEVEALLHRTGARITNREAPTSRSVASVDPDQPNTINIDDMERFGRDKNARNQTLSHEAVHIWHQNLPPEVQRMIPMDDPKDLYGKNNIGYDQDELKNMRSQGLTLANLPREKAGAVIQTYAHLGGDDAPKAIREVYKPWADDLVHSQLSTIQPTSVDTPGLVTTPRAPAGADLHETKILGDEKEKKPSKDAPSGTKHGAGDVVGYDSEDGLPIIRRKSVAARANEPSPKPAKEDSPDGKRDILHASKDRAELVQEARDEAPLLKEGLEVVADKVPGAEVDAVRAEKSPKRLDEKIKREGQPVETIPDILAGRLAVDSDEAHGGTADMINRHTTVVRDQDNFKKGDSRFGYRAHKLQVQVSPKLSAEVHIVPKETAAQDDKQHPIYKQAREAELDGDINQANELAEKAKSMNDAAKSRFDRRNGEKSQEPVKESKGREEAAPASEGHKVGDRVTLPNGKSATVAYVPSKGAQLPTYRFKGDDGTTTTMRASEAHTRVKKAPDDVKGTVLVDLDRTLSFARGQESRTHIGAPEPAMVARIKDDLAAGKKVKIFTARVANDPTGKVREAIQAWSKKHLGVALDVTDKKMGGTGEILDDKAEHVRPNTGRISA